MTTKALVIGGGIGGLSTTLALQRAGLEAHVVEGANGLREIGAGVMIWANAVKALDHLGLSDSLHRITSPLHVMQTRTIDGRVLQTIPYPKPTRNLATTVSASTAESFSSCSRTQSTRPRSTWVRASSALSKTARPLPHSSLTAGRWRAVF
jgi:2-polyprenyl-6-methoxyphenol hydroxylase-like FAD-dependent oxidoreductase